MNQARHAYLIIVHSNPYVLEKLVLMLDDVRNDIYIHVDKKTANFDFDYFRSLAKKSTLRYIDHRIDVRWGHVSQVAVEQSLFRAAYQNGEYSYFHLISGSDLPIKSQDYIHSFFEKNKDKEFIGFSNDVFDTERITKMYLFPKYMRVDGRVLWQRALRNVREKFLSLQRFFNYNYRKIEDTKFVYGSNWVSLSNALVGDLIEKEKWFLRFYKYANCCDEIYKQSFVYNSDYINNVYDLDDELRGCMRLMDWQRGRPYTFRKEDLDMIMDSEMLFARKFEDSVDSEIVDLIYSRVRNQQ